MKLVLLVPSCILFFSFQENTVTGEKENQNNCFPSCPKGWEEKEGRCFLWPDPVLSWANAEKFCNDEGGHLASVTNLEIHNYIWSKLNPKARDTFFWIGGTDQDKEGKWKWTDGSDWNFTKWATSPKKQPDNYNWLFGSGGQHCLQIYSFSATNGWDDQDCEKERKFVCSQRLCQDSTTTTKNDTTTTATTNNEIRITGEQSVDNNQMLIIVASTAGGIIFVLLTALVTICLYVRHKRSNMFKVDVSDIYGTYYEGGVEYSTVEVNSFFSPEICSSKSEKGQTVDFPLSGHQPLLCQLE